MRMPLVYWLIAAALVMNVVVFFWPRDPAPSADFASPPSLRQLKLLSEVETGQPPGSVEPAPSSPAPEPEFVPEASPQPELKPDTVAVADTVAEETTAAASPEVVDSAPADAAAPEAPAPAPVEPVVVAEPSPPRCWLAGPVEGDMLSERLAAEFAGAGTGMDLVLRTVEVAPEHWVYLPTSGSQADVRRLSRELRQAGFDNFQITDGPLAGSLSMGLFRSEERAAALRDRLRGQGHRADVFPRPAFRDEPWAAIDDRAREALGWPAEGGAVPGYEALQLIERECPASRGG